MGHLPVLKTPLLVRDVLSDGHFSSHPVVTRLGARAVVGMPVQAGAHRPVVGTLWALSTAPEAFGEARVELLRQTAAVVGELLSPSTTEHELFQLVMSLPTAAVAVVGQQLKLNAHAAAITGYTGAELPTLDRWFEALFRDDAAVVRELYEADRKTGFLDARIAPITRKDGWERLVQVHATAVGEGELWMLTDITERVASQERFRLLFEQSSTPHLLLDATGIVDCNPAAVALLGYRSKSDLLRLQPRDLSPERQPDGRRSHEKAVEMERLAFEQGSHRYDWVHQTAAGVQVPVEVTLTPQTFGAQRVLLVEWHDLTERVHYEEGLKRARDSAMEYARAKSDFLAVMSHEIRTPMNGVIGLTRLLLDTSLSTQQREYVDGLRACGEGLLALINDILDFSRLEAGKVTLEQIPLSLRDLVDEAVSVVADAAEGKALSLVVVADASAPDRVLGDPTRLRQVLLNLLSNAVKFTERGGVEVRLSSARADDKGRPVVTLAVKDSGIGIAPSAVPRLFSSFSQEDSSTTRRFGGSGLGLAICKRLVGLMGGDIGVETGDTGTTFFVTVAFDEAPAASGLLALTGRRVVVVAPPSVSRLSLEQLLTAAGARVETADSELQAKARCEAAEVVLVDDEAHGAAARAMAARLVAPHRTVGVLTSPRTPASEFPPGCFRLARPLRRRQVLDALARALVLPVPQRVEVKPAEPAPFPGLRVLVAEDNPINQRVIRGLLGKLGCTVQVAENGQEALDVLAGQAFDVVFMDCQMPVLDGFETTRQLRARHGPTLPVIALTAGTMGGDKERCFEAGMTDFLAKPVRPEDLLRMLGKHGHPATLPAVG
ncbi:MAG: response regulator [Myxococcaceae bacterium]|nr:response regulator [Myxococcaceae bacterium]MCA3015108.1 response regulator [Myxococcaceae bacterium]